MFLKNGIAVKLSRDKFKPIVVLGSDQIKADISVADGESR
jgi:hypothetical protein